MTGGEAIKHYRDLANMTLDALAQAVGVKSTTITKWQNGEIQQPRRDKIELVDDVLKADGAILRAFGYVAPVDMLGLINDLRSEFADVAEQLHSLTQRFDALEQQRTP